MALHRPYELPIRDVAMHAASLESSLSLSVEKKRLVWRFLPPCCISPPGRAHSPSRSHRAPAGDKLAISGRPARGRPAVPSGRGRKRKWRSGAAAGRASLPIKRCDASPGRPALPAVL